MLILRYLFLLCIFAGNKDIFGGMVMSRNKKQLLPFVKAAGLLVLLIFIGLTPVFAAGGQAEKGGTGQKVDLKWWSNGRHDLAYRTAGVEQFNAANPDIQIKYEVFTEDYFNTLELSFQSGQAPDMFSSANNPVMYYVERNMCLPLNDYITPQFRARFADPFTIEGVNTVDGKQYSLPEVGVTFRLMYNKEIFKAAGIPEPPKTMDEYYTIAKRITDWGKSRGIYGTAQQLKVVNSVGERVFDQLAYRNGSSSYNFRTGRYDFSVMKPVLEYFRRMYADGIMFPGSEGMEIDMVRAQFADGKIAMYFNGSWEVGIYAKGGQFPAKQDWGAVVYPGLKTPNPAGKTKLWGAGNSWAISTSCKNPDAAWKYFEFLFSDEIVGGYQGGGYGFILLPDAAAKAAVPEGMIGFKEFSINPAVEKIWPVSPDMLNLVVEGRRAYEIYVAIVIGAVDMDAGLADLTTRYNVALDKGVADGTVKRTIDVSFDPTK
jgi:multiple sugar transport system substrate-binding protein